MIADGLAKRDVYATSQVARVLGFSTLIADGTGTPDSGRMQRLSSITLASIGSYWNAGSGSFYSTELISRTNRSGVLSVLGEVRRNKPQAYFNNK